MRRILLCCLVLALAACSDAPADDATGVEIFDQLCASCHGRDLSGGIGPALGPGSDSIELSDDVLAMTIRQGRGSRMPAFSRTLSPEQVATVVAYLRERQDG
jgi:mono/diheme cytochrome c family protein